MLHVRFAQVYPLEDYLGGGYGALAYGGRPTAVGYLDDVAPVVRGPGEMAEGGEVAVDDAEPLAGAEEHGRGRAVGHHLGDGVLLVSAQLVETLELGGLRVEGLLQLGVDYRVVSVDDVGGLAGVRGDEDDLLLDRGGVLDSDGRHQVGEGEDDEHGQVVGGEGDGHVAEVEDRGRYQHPFVGGDVEVVDAEGGAGAGHGRDLYGYGQRYIELLDFLVGRVDGGDVEGRIAD